jgi:outer membrane protein OmpA-like peptidoglycan-associated protein
VGGLLDFRFYTKLRSMGFRWGSFSVLPMGMVTFDAREQADLQWPLVAHMNLGYFVDNSFKVLTSTSGDSLTFDGNVTASRLAALNVKTGNQIIWNWAFEFPQEDYTVFLEYSTEQEVDNKLGRGVRKGSWAQSPQRFTPGVRWNFVDRLIADFAVDLSYGLGTDYIVNRVKARPTTPYQFWLGLTYSYDPGSHKVIDTRGFVKGIVVDAETGEPIGGAIVQYPGSDATRQVTRGDDGNFTSFPLLPGQAKIRIVKEKYEPVVITPLILGQETITEKVLLRKMDEGGQLVGALVGTVLDSTAKPVAATLSFVEAEIAGTRSNAADGAFVKILPPGQYKVKVEADGYETKVFLVPVEARRKTKVVFELPASGASASDQGALAGVLVDPEGRPIGGTIRFPEAGIREVAANPQTGEFYASLPPGRYKIEVESAGYGKRDYLVPIEAGKKTRIDIKLAQSQVVGAVAGRVLTADNQPLAGVIKFADAKIGVIPVDPSTGGFMKIVPVGTYDVEISAPGYLSQSVKIEVLERKKTVQDFVLEAEGAAATGLARIDGDGIALERPISLAKGSTDLSASDKEVLDAVAALLKRNPRKLVVRAYTDDEGPANANFKATQAQAEAVVAYLASQGIEAARLSAVGGGEEKPLAPNTTAENKARNRRIEFQLR